MQGFFMGLMKAIIGALGRREKWGGGADNRFNRLILTLCVKISRLRCKVGELAREHLETFLQPARISAGYRPWFFGP
jgi:hypothetical protein